jgi:hypothetical protein
MNNTIKIFWLLIILLVVLPSSYSFAQSSPIAVNVLNYVKAKSAFHFGRVYAKSGGINKWVHIRNPVPIDQQRVSRMNRDTLYSSIVVDISKGAKLFLPQAQGRYMSAAIINEDHYINKIFHQAGEILLKPEDYDTDFILITVRILVNANKPEDILAVNKLQDSLSLKSASDRDYTPPNYAKEDLFATGKHLTQLAAGLKDARNSYGSEKSVNNIKHLLVSAFGWGGLPETEAFYINSKPNLTNGAYTLTVNNVPVDGFWSISVYNKEGFFQENQYDAYSINNLTAQADTNGTITIHFGGEQSKSNFLPITEGWSYVVRMYQPKPEIIQAKWMFPDLVSTRSGNTQH